MSNFIQGMVQQLVADQRANAEESRNQAISIANLAGQEQRMKMLESEYQAKEDERNRKNAFNTELSNLASNLLYEQKEVADANGNLRMQTVPKQFANQGDQISAIAQLQAGKLALAVKHKMVDEKTLQDSYTFSRQLEKDGTNNLIENFFANPNDPKNVAAMATKFGLDPNTTKIGLGRDGDGMPTVIAEFVGPDGKPQKRDLSPVLNAMGADAYIRMVEGAKTRSAIQENKSTIELNRAKANSEGQPKALNAKDKVSMIKDMTSTLLSTVKTTKETEVGTKEFIGNEAERKKIIKEIDSGQFIASKIIDISVKQGSYELSPLVAFGYGRDAARNGDAAATDLHRKGNLRGFKSIGKDVYAVTNDGYYIPVNKNQLVNFDQYIDVQSKLNASQPNTTVPVNTNSQAIPTYDPN